MCKKISSYNEEESNGALPNIIWEVKVMYIVYYYNGTVCQMTYTDYIVAKRHAIDLSVKYGSAELYESEKKLATYKDGEKW